MSSLSSVPRRPTSNSHDHKMLQSASENIKSDAKANILAPCEGKGCPGRLTKKVCSGCKAASYCSVECQRSVWPTHRSICKPRSVRMKRLLTTLIRNQIFSHMLQALFIVHFKLAERTQVGPSSGPLCIGASIAMLPYGWTSRDDVYQTTPARPLPIAVTPSGIDSSGRRRNAGVEVFLQITGLAYLSDTHPQKFSREHKLAWEQVTSTYLPPSPEFEVLFFGLLLIHDGDKYSRDSIYPLPIRKKEIEAFRNGTYFSSYSFAEPVLGERVPRPLTTTSLIQYINRHIEADIENYFCLRTFLKPDKGTLLTWGHGVLRILTGRDDLPKEEVVQCLRVYNPDGSKLNLRHLDS